MRVGASGKAGLALSQKVSARLEIATPRAQETRDTGAGGGADRNHHATHLLMEIKLPTTKRFASIVKLINAADPDHLYEVLKRVLSSLPDKAMGGFSETEMEQMRSLFGLSALQMELLLGGCAFIFEQAAYATTPPGDLRTELTAAGIGEDAARAFSSTWQAGAAECVQKLKDQSVLAPLQLSGVDWQLCVGTAASAGERGQSSHTCLQLDLEPLSASGSSGGGGGADSGVGVDSGLHMHMRLGREEMSGLLGKLDLIQAQMDRHS